MIKMLNHDMIHGGTQAIGLGVIIGRRSPDSQHGKPSCHPVNVGCSFFRYTNDDLRNHNIQKREHKTWTGKTTNLYYTVIGAKTI